MLKKVKQKPIYKEIFTEFTCFCDTTKQHYTVGRIHTFTSKKWFWILGLGFLNHIQNPQKLDMKPNIFTFFELFKVFSY